MEEYIGIIKLFGGNFEPKGWAFCNGQLLSIAKYTSLFAVIGNTYGGNGINNFALPDMRGRIPIGTGQGDGLGKYSQGQTGGSETTTLSVPHIPPHHHTAHLHATTTNVTHNRPEPGSVISAPGKNTEEKLEIFYVVSDSAPDVTLNTISITLDSVGNGTSFNNMQPYIGMNYIICIEGVFPPRNEFKY